MHMDLLEMIAAVIFGTSVQVFCRILCSHTLGRVFLDWLDGLLFNFKLFPMP